MYSILRKILFLFDAELIHEFSVHSIKTFNKIPLIDILIKKCFCVNDKRLERTILGLKFKNPVGLAAGFDKSDLTQLGAGLFCARVGNLLARDKTHG